MPLHPLIQIKIQMANWVNVSIVPLTAIADA
jgi:hypothetical protein